MKNILEHKWTANVAAILGVLVAIVVPIAIYFLQKSDTAGPKPDVGTYWTSTVIFLIAIICILLLIQSVSFIIAHIRHNKIKEQTAEAFRVLQESYEVIGKLSALQESYILTPQYVTATEHGNHSKEGTLSKGGTADILTNSLKYDIFYSDGIAANIIRGSKYVYILPNTSSMLRDLRDYIMTICNSIQREFQLKGVNGSLTKLDELRSINLEFWFFNSDKPCLYNFAIFRQTAEDGLLPYEQYWWYINPSDKNPDSHMLAYEIRGPRDRCDLDEAFEKLKKSASKKSGQDIYANRDNLHVYLGTKQ